MYTPYLYTGVAWKCANFANTTSKKIWNYIKHFVEIYIYIYY